MDEYSDTTVDSGSLQRENAAQEEGDAVHFSQVKKQFNGSLSTDESLYASTALEPLQGPEPSGMMKKEELESSKSMNESYYASGDLQCHLRENSAETGPEPSGLWMYEECNTSTCIDTLQTERRPEPSGLWKYEECNTSTCIDTLQTERNAESLEVDQNMNVGEDQSVSKPLYASLLAEPGISLDSSTTTHEQAEVLGGTEASHTFSIPETTRAYRQRRKQELVTRNIVDETNSGTHRSKSAKPGSSKIPVPQKCSYDVDCFSCPICRAKFWIKEDLEKHIEVHSGVKLLVCQECNVQSERKSCILKHLLLHSYEDF